MQANRVKKRERHILCSTKGIRFDPFDCAQALFFKGGIKARSE
jgi:hypothetical protein